MLRAGVFGVVVEDLDGCVARAQRLAQRVGVEALVRGIGVACFGAFVEGGVIHERQACAVRVDHEGVGRPNVAGQVVGQEQDLADKLFREFRSRRGRQEDESIILNVDGRGRAGGGGRGLCRDATSA